MTCHEIAKRLAKIQPELSSVDIARLSLMILTHLEVHGGSIESDQELLAVWKRSTFQLEAATDQHAAVASELEALCSDGPTEFSPDQLWILLRAVKVQSQLIELYTNQPALV